MYVDLMSYLCSQDMIQCCSRTVLCSTSKCQMTVQLNWSKQISIMASHVVIPGKTVNHFMVIGPGPVIKAVKTCNGTEY